MDCNNSSPWLLIIFIFLFERWFDLNIWASDIRVQWRIRYQLSCSLDRTFCRSGLIDSTIFIYWVSFFVARKRAYFFLSIWRQILKIREYIIKWIEFAFLLRLGWLVRTSDWSRPIFWLKRRVYILTQIELIFIIDLRVTI